MPNEVQGLHSSPCIFYFQSPSLPTVWLFVTFLYHPPTRLHDECKINCSEFVQRYPQYAPRSIYSYANKPIDSVVDDHRKSTPVRTKTFYF